MLFPEFWLLTPFPYSPIFAALMTLQTTPLQKLIVHLVGNKNNADPIHLSQSSVELNDDLKAILGDSFLSRFKNNHEWYSFSHRSSLQYNEAYNYCRQIFSNAESFEETSRTIAQHLYEQSTHPKIKGGELYIAYFDALPVESRMCKAIGLFKTENKALFLETEEGDANIGVVLKEGIELTKIDKGCLVIDQKTEEGFDVLVFDNQNRGEEALYWKEGFLTLAAQKNEYHNTQHLLTLTKQFITGLLETEMHIDKAEQVDLLHKSIDYFKTNESFDIDDFQAKVFIQEDRIDAFRNFGSRYVGNNDFDLAAQFDISPEAVKKQSRIFKSVIKLDRNFHIYVHGRTDLIEKGVDGDGRKFYKIYYQDEG
ncbi:MAG TPA: nucleoid-associated protein [Flavisolibacter sp.]|nr:nucleoid-associated protein [Flavisolibacter sp.]